MAVMAWNVTLRDLDTDGIKRITVSWGGLNLCLNRATDEYIVHNGDIFHTALPYKDFSKIVNEFPELAKLFKEKFGEKYV
jgi:hypothetical protein